MARWTFVETIKQTLDDILETRSETVLIGCGIGADGGFMKTTDGLLKKYDHKRIIDMPADGWGMIGCAIGIALSGQRPIVEISPELLLRGGLSQISMELTQIRFRSAGNQIAPLIIRVPYGATSNPEHLSFQISETLLTNLPGIRIVVPSGAADERALLMAAIAQHDPVIVLEPLPLYFGASSLVPDETPTTALERAVVEREGADLSIITFGAAVSRCLEAASRLNDKKIGCEVVNVRSLSPCDEETILGTLKKTGHVLIVHDSKCYCGFGAEISAILAERGTDYIQAPIKRLGGLDVPAGDRYLTITIPSAEQISAAAGELMQFNDSQSS